MALTKTLVLLLGAASLGLTGCSKMMPNNQQMAGGPTGAPSQGLAAIPPQQPMQPMAPQPVAAQGTQTLDFGDDNGKYSRDGECDDPRFAGAGMTDTPLLDTDIRHDATDCRTAFNQGRLTLRGDTTNPASGYAESGVNHIIWGDDNGKYSRDGECDDKRFQGAGMTDTPLLDTDIKHDATDCRTAFNQGRLTLRN